jgi:hypothetical protein
LQEENGLYGYSFGFDGELADVWSDQQFKETLLAVHAFNKIIAELETMQAENDDAAILYCFIFLLFFVAGPGRWSVDRTYSPSGDTR